MCIPGHVAGRYCGSQGGAWESTCIFQLRTGVCVCVCVCCILCVRSIAREGVVGRKCTKKAKQRVRACHDDCPVFYPPPLCGVMQVLPSGPTTTLRGVPGLSGGGGGRGTFPSCTHTQMCCAGVTPPSLATTNVPSYLDANESNRATNAGKADAGIARANTTPLTLSTIALWNLVQPGSRLLARSASVNPPDIPALSPLPPPPSLPPRPATQPQPQLEFADDEHLIIAARWKAIRDAIELAAARVASHPNIVQVFVTLPDVILKPLDDRVGGGGSGAGGVELPVALLPWPQNAVVSTPMWLGGDGVGMGLSSRTNTQRDPLADLVQATGINPSEGSQCFTKQLSRRQQLEQQPEQQLKQQPEQQPKQPEQQPPKRPESGISTDTDEPMPHDALLLSE
ncbi:hypothetical protein Vretifemale_5644 [Volvox reticuliferus]|uniref:Uncharacterized protein n=1 Tax=Volvox reticuliferus TaxID=1737510 RepID=A0A8J4C5K3_9CHLO|nr:hypothetical protein Vretifemale_5644 [Volvox reticuliferus]